MSVEQTCRFAEPTCAPRNVGGANLPVCRTNLRAA